ncbi:MAG TPA: amidase, partial [Dehalococcoidia bacterium]|nr:amidase [Dehalococcoidia bacterium]
TAGPLTRTVGDCALLMNLIAGYDPNDFLSAHLPVPDYTAVLDRDVNGMRMAVVKEMLEAEHLHPEVKARVEEATRRFEALGATVEEISVPLVTLSNVISSMTGSDRTALQWTYLMQRPQDYDMATRRFSLLPALVPASLYQRVLQLRSLLRDQVLDACGRYDVLITPCQPTPPPLIEDTRQPLQSREAATADLRRFSFSNAAAIAGVPAISVPCGFTEDNLPVGLQIMARRFDEEAVFRAAYAYEQDTPWHTMRPPVG